MPFVPLQTTDKQGGYQPLGFIPLDDAPADDTHENAAIKTLRAIGQVYPVAETAANLATQAVALPAAGLAGLGALATNAAGLTDADPASVVHDVGAELTYQPQTELGQHLTNATLYPLEKLAEAGSYAGNKTLEATGSPLAATAVDTAINALPMAIAPAFKGAKWAIKGAKEAMARKATAEPLPTAAAVEAEAPSGFTPLDASQEITEPTAQAAHGAIETGQATPEAIRSEEHAAKPGIEGYSVDEAGADAAQPQVECLTSDGVTEQAAEPRGFQALPASPADEIQNMGGNADNQLTQGANDGQTGQPGQAGRDSGLARPELQAEQDLRTTVAGGRAAPGWAEATRASRNGIPADLYRGSSNALSADSFDQEALGKSSGHPSAGLGVWFTPSKAEAAGYGTNVGKFHLDIRNPKIIKAEDLPAFDDVAAAHAWREKLREQGYDSVIVTAKHLGGPVHAVAFEPHQVIHTTKRARYALIEADDLKPSHNTDLRPIADNPFGRQGTSRQENEQAVQGIVRDFDPARLAEAHDDAGGAPIVAADGVVEAGQRRAIALQRVYEANGQKAADYRQHLKVIAPLIGLRPERVEAMKKPVLVRLPDEPAPRVAPEGGKVQDMAASVQNGTWAPGANYVPFVDAVRQSTNQAKTVADLPEPIRREQIIKDFAKDIGTSVYEGRVKGKKLGFFRPRNEEVRIKRANDIEVAAHEVAHLIDSRVPAIANAWRSDKALREELKSVSYDQKSVQEGFAEAMRLYLTQPDILAAKAPKAHAWLESFARSHEYGPALRKAQADMTAWFGQDALNRARSKIGAEKPLSEYFDGFWDRFRQATADDLHGVMKMERDLKGKIEPAGPYESARLARASASIADGAVRYGHPVRKPDGSFTFKGKGLEEILKPVAENLDDALLYFVGRSSRELMVQGREHLFTSAEVDAMLKLATPERKKAFEEYQAWNKGILDFAESAGVINGQARAMWQRTQYLPFHRVGQAGAFKGAKPGDWSGIKALTGGTENIRDVLGNMVSNAAQLIDKAVKNEARAKIADLANQAKGGRFMVKIDAEARPVKIDRQQVVDAILKTMGIDRSAWQAHGQKIPKVADKLIKEMEDAPEFLEFMIGNQPPAGRNVVAVLRNGKPEWYEVGDPILYRALDAIDRKNQHWLIKWLGLPKRVGQASITLVPDFWVANIARDTIMGSVMSQHGFKPVLDSLRGMRMRITNDPVYMDYIANGGGLSSIYLDETKLRAKLDKFYTRQGIDYHTVLDTPEKPLGFVETLGDAFEMSTRLGEYKRAIDAGEHPRHAAYLGRDVSTDFAMRGDSQALGMMYDTVMFLKPAVLSWDRLYRGLAHDSNRGAIAAKAGAMALASAALYLLNRNDPRYQDLPDWDRDANWHFFIGDQHFRYPKIWEIGALSSAAERTVERTLDKNPENLGQDFARILAQTFNLNLMPQIVAPLYEQATNRNSFTGSPIETPGMENVQPFLRAKPGTSETMKALGMATANLPESVQVNPARAEALLRGYFNTWAMYGLMLSDQAFFHEQLPEKRADELPVVRRFYEQEPARHTKYEDQFYTLLDEAGRLQGTLRELDRIGRPDMADLKQQERLAGQAKPLQRAAKNLQEINADMRLVRRDSNLTPQDKRARLDSLTVERNALLKSAVQDTEASMKSNTVTPTHE